MSVIAEAAPTADEIDVNNLFDEKTGIQYIGKARRGFDGRWTCLAQVGYALCVVELTVRPTVRVDGDPGDEDVPRNCYW